MQERGSCQWKEVTTNRRIRPESGLAWVDLGYFASDIAWAGSHRARLLWPRVIGGWGGRIWRLAKGKGREEGKKKERKGKEEKDVEGKKSGEKEKRGRKEKKWVLGFET